MKANSPIERENKPIDSTGMTNKPESPAKSNFQNIKTFVGSHFYINGVRLLEGSEIDLLTLLRVK